MGEDTDVRKYEIERKAIKGLQEGNLMELANAIESGIYEMNPRLANLLVHMINYEGGVVIAKNAAGEPLYTDKDSVFSDFVLVLKKHPKLKSIKQGSNTNHVRVFGNYEIATFIEQKLSLGETLESASFLGEEQFGISDSRIRQRYREYKKEGRPVPVWDKDRTSPKLK